MVSISKTILVATVVICHNGLRLNSFIVVVGRWLCYEDLHKMTHQEAIIETLHRILTQKDEIVRIFSRGNPFDKLLRSYDQFTSTGLPLYKSKRGKDHYRYSRKAAESKLEASELYGEHRVPLSIIRQRLLECDRSVRSIKTIMESNEVVLITKEEQRLLDSKEPTGLGLRSTIPKCGTDRLEFANIEVAQESLGNKL